MVLVDTNIIVDIWKNKDEEYTRVFNSERVCICGVIRSELLHGAYSEKNLAEISLKLDMITEININESDWDGFGRFLYKLRTNGLSVPYPDALIAYTAIKYNLSVLTKDKHFKLIQIIDPRLKMYSAHEIGE
ncbi:MAG: PIN domain-containing protein [Bilifractor sp.]